MSSVTISEAEPIYYPAIRKMVWESHQTIYGGQSIPENDESFFEWAYSDETLGHLAQQSNTWQGIATTDIDEVIGYTVIQLVDGSAELLRHYISPDYQRQGIGGHLLDQAIAEVSKFGPVEKVWLAVLRENPVGRSFYEKYGFAHERDESPHPEFGAYESYYVLRLGEKQDATAR